MIVRASPHIGVLMVAMFEDDQSNVEVAELLVISPKAVRDHVSNILSKLQVADRAEAIVRAREAGPG